MALGLGYKGGLFQFGEETDYGTKDAIDNAVEFVSESLTKEQPHLQKAGLNSLIRDKDDVAKGQVGVSGDIEFEPRYEGFKTIFEHALGSINTTNPGTDTQLHTITMADTLPTGLTMEVDMDQQAKEVTGGKINSLSFEAEADGYLTSSIGIIGQELDYNATATTGNSVPSANLIPFSNIEVSYGGSPIDTRDFSIELANNLDDGRYYLNSRNIKEPLRGSDRPEVTGSLTIDFEDNSEYNDFINQTTSEIVITATGDEIETVDATTYNYELVITLPNVILTGGVPEVSDLGIIPLEIPFRAYAEDESTRSMKIEVQNTIA